MSVRAALVISVIGFYCGIAFIVFALFEDFWAGLLGSVGASAVWLSAMAFKNLRGT